MAITELACLRFTNNLSLTDPANAALNDKLRRGIQAQAEYTNAKASILSGINEPSYIFIIGSWASVEQHMEEWIPSATNQEIMGSLDGLELVWILHFDFDQSTAQGDGIPYRAEDVEIARYFVSKADKEGFEETFNKYKSERGQTAYGWRLDGEAKPGAEFEFIVLAGNQIKNDLPRMKELEKFITDSDIQHAKWEFHA
ncbi:hypothetical protein BDV18DRAFT_26460 [Aspergillus unguis]